MAGKKKAKKKIGKKTGKQMGRKPGSKNKKTLAALPKLAHLVLWGAEPFAPQTLAVFSDQKIAEAFIAHMDPSEVRVVTVTATPEMTLFDAIPECWADGAELG